MFFCIPARYHTYLGTFEVLGAKHVSSPDLHALLYAWLYALLHTWLRALLHALLHAWLHALLHTWLHALLFTWLHHAFVGAGCGGWRRGRRL